jgi:hypothetical protein
VTSIAYALLAMAASGLSAPHPATGAPGSRAVEDVQVAQMMIQQRIIIRVPAVNPPSPPHRPIRLKEVKGPKCVTLNQLAGASIGQNDAVDLFMRGGMRLRAQLDDDCPALDYYAGFYIAPTADGKVCQRRDMLHTRAGQQCRVKRFYLLVPDR